MVNVKETGKTATDFVQLLLEKNFFVRNFAKNAGLEPETHFRISVGLQKDMEELVDHMKNFVK
jgi:histidinol-phosphate/aromatic aminotransferase/cobyric acid decarboxylase-like protein